jgi:hypothetical protein
LGSLVLALLLAAAPVRAAPAVIKVFEGTARQAPGADAPVLHVFAEQTAVFVSEDVKDGWRRVRVPDGKIGYIRDDEVALVAPPATAPVAPPPPVAAPAVQPLPAGPPAAPVVATNARAIIYVEDLDHLAELVKSDNVVHPKAEALANNQKGAAALMVTGGVIGSLVVIGSFTFLASQSCPTSYPPLCTTNPSVGGIVVGSLISLAGLIGGVALLPSRGDLLDVINEWNARHRDQPFTLERAPGMAAY